MDPVRSPIMAMACGNQPVIPPPAIRSAEGDRKASCAFSDRVAELSIAKYKEVTPPELLESYKQTVLAAFLLHDLSSEYEGMDGDHYFMLSCNPSVHFSFPLIFNRLNQCLEESLMVVSIGVGTKIITRDQLAMCDNFEYILESSQSLSLSSATSSSLSLSRPSKSIAFRDRVLDCHAEVLAHRGFKRFLLEQSLHALKPSSSAPSIFEVVGNGSMLCLKLKPHIKFHLYSSSQPCGNASIKRWAKNKGVTQFPTLSSNEYPKMSHPKFFPCAKREGQVATLCKRDRAPTQDNECEDMYDGDCIYVHEGTYNRHDYASTSDDSFIPHGLCKVDSDEGYIMSCSDKIAKWNALGIQSALMSNLLIDGPIYLETITVGRKFSQVHCERALCCRLTSIKGFHSDLSTRPSAYHINHPTMMSTSIKFDNSVIQTSSSAPYELPPVEYGLFLSSSLYPAPHLEEVLAQVRKEEEDKFGAKFEEGRSLMWTCLSLPSLSSSSCQGLVEIIGRDGYVMSRLSSEDDTSIKDIDKSKANEDNNNDKIVGGDEAQEDGHEDEINLYCSFIDATLAPIVPTLGKTRDNDNDSFNIIEASFATKKRSKKQRRRGGNVGEEKKNACLCGLKGLLCARNKKKKPSKNTKNEPREVLNVEQERLQKLDALGSKVSCVSGVALSALFEDILLQLCEKNGDQISRYPPVNSLEDGNSDYVCAKSLLMNDNQSVFRGSWRSRSRCVL